MGEQEPAFQELLNTDELISTEHISPLWNCDKFTRTSVTQHDVKLLSRSSYRSTMQLFISQYTVLCYDCLPNGVGLNVLFDFDDK